MEHPGLEGTPQKMNNSTFSLFICWFLPTLGSSKGTKPAGDHPEGVTNWLLEQKFLSFGNFPK